MLKNFTAYPIPQAAILTSVIAITALLMHPFGPYGFFWPPSPMCPVPRDWQLPFFAFVALVEAGAFGAGWAFLLWGKHYVDRLFDATWRRNIVYVCTAWQLLNWYPHDSLHMHIGVDLTNMIFMEIGFHVTLVISGLLIILAFITQAHRQFKLSLA